MSDRVNAELVKRFRKYGTGDWNAVLCKWD